jgi:hypothetical protein
MADLGFGDSLLCDSSSGMNPLRRVLGTAPLLGERCYNVALGYLPSIVMQSELRSECWGIKFRVKQFTRLVNIHIKFNKLYKAWL